MRHFDEQLKELFQRLTYMGELASSMVHAAVRCLIERTESHCQEVYDKEHEVNALQVEVDDRAVKLTALQQPMGPDVRFLFMSSRIGGELERIADQAINICQNIHFAFEGPPPRSLLQLPQMAELAETMVRDSLAAMARHDPNLANRVLEIEKRVDELRNVIFRELLEEITSDPSTAQRSLSLILVARNLERVGDHATNIAEEVIYWLQGRDIRHAMGDSKPPDQGQ